MTTDDTFRAAPARCWSCSRRPDKTGRPGRAGGRCAEGCSRSSSSSTARRTPEPALLSGRRSPRDAVEY